MVDKPKRLEVLLYRDTPDNSLNADHFLRVFMGESLSEICVEYTNHLEMKEVLVDRVAIPYDQLSDFVPKPGSRIEITPRPGWWPIVGAALGWLGSTVPSIILSMAFSYLGGILFQQNLPESDRNQGTGRQSFGFDTGNIQTEGGPIPIEYGANMRYGTIVSRWTSVDDDDNEQLYLKIAHCEGPTEGVDLNKVYINNQPVGNFADVTVQQRYGYDDQTAMTGFDVDKIEVRSNAEITYTGGAMTFNLPRSGFDQIEFTLGFDRGIYYYDDMGDQGSSTVGVKVEVSEVGAGSWTTLVNGSIVKNQISPY